MKTIAQLYKPFNFSTTRCYVIAVTITEERYIRIEHKLPKSIRHLKGIYVSASCNSYGVAGRISLNFNGQSLKAFHLPVHKTHSLNDCSHPYTLNEQINLNSFMQGYFISTQMMAQEYPFTISIYLHYTP